MSIDWVRDIQNFHEAFNFKNRSTPGIPDTESATLWRKLIKEEYLELVEGLTAGEMTMIADGMTDLIVVILGGALAYGIDLRPVWDEVHRTNMLKVGGKRREDGKLLKPEGWRPPKINEALKRQGWTG